jgi:O-antigen/teichoic acid export membrane protein
MSDSLKKRFSFKLATNLIGLVASLMVAGIVPRGLGPAAYGNFSFLTDFFNRIFNFFDVGTSSAFYTKLSQKPNRFGIIRFYRIFIGLVLLIVAIGTILILSSKYKEILWPRQEVLYIILALGFAFITWSNKISAKMIDAYVLTTKGSILQMIQKFVQVGLIFAMFALGFFTLFNYFVFQYVVLLILGVGYTWILFNHKVPYFPKRKLKQVETKAYIKSFYTYSSPLIFFALFGLVEGIFDRWLLQTYAGSVQQGYYGLALRISALCLLFSKAMMPLIMREFAIAHSKNDVAKIKQTYLKYVPVFFFIVAFISIFISINADTVSVLVGGNSFKYASFAIMIMALYPIHQTLGQFNGTFFLGTSHTKLYSKIGITFMFIGLPLTYIMIAPLNLFGLNLGSTGLAIKMVMLNLIGVNVELWFIAKLLNFSFFKLLLMQFKAFGILLPVAYAGNLIASYAIDAIFWEFIVSGLFYLFIISFIVFAFPQLLNISRARLVKIIYGLLKKVNIIK